MRLHTQDFKNKIKIKGRQLDSKITYGEVELGNEQLNAVTPVLKSSMLKSVMKELDIDSNVDIPVGTVINYKFGIRLNNSDYEYLDFGNYQVYSTKKQEDTNSYNIIAYDKMLNSMVPYEKMNIEYPISIRNYLKAICDELNINFASENDEFANYDKIISSELYLDDSGNSLDYTFRDVLDELAQATASNIVINSNDELEVRYIADTNDTIDEEYLQDINVAFGEKYGKINSIVLSRSAGADNVYWQDEQSVADNGLCELKITDNQIMNGNDRSDYLPAILEKLNGLEYYINDFSSTGICYYEVADRYNVKVGENTYSCVMFNDEIDITQGLEETIYTDLPEQAETDYTKADKTDRRINQTYLIVDKQNQKIESVVSQTDGFNERITKAEQTVDGFRQTVEDMQQIIDEGGFVDEQRLQSAITQSAGQIEASVSQQITDAEGNIKQDVNGQLNLYIKKGATGDVVSAFNLASDEVEIHSTNFNLEANGSLECTGATINNGKLTVTESRFDPSFNNATVTIQSPRNQMLDASTKIGSQFILQVLDSGAIFNLQQLIGYDQNEGFIGIRSYGTGLGSSSISKTEISSGKITTDMLSVSNAPEKSTDVVRLQDLNNKWVRYNLSSAKTSGTVSGIPDIRDTIAFFLFRSTSNSAHVCHCGGYIQANNYFILNMYATTIYVTINSVTSSSLNLAEIKPANIELYSIVYWKK